MRVLRCCKRGVGAAALALAIPAALLILPSSTAYAQEGENPLRFLKPWLEQQLRGLEPAEEAAEPVDPADGPPGSAGAADGPRFTLPEAGMDNGDAAAEGAAVPSAADATDEAIIPERGEGQSEATEGPADARSAPDPWTPEAPETPETETALPAETSPEATPPPRERKAEPLRLAVLAGRDVTATLRVVGEVADDLQARLGRPVEILPMSSYEAMIDAQGQRRVDGGFYSGAAFALAESLCECLEPIVAPRTADGSLAFGAVIVTRNGAGIESLADLQGKSVAVGTPDSIGSRRIQLAGLMAEGINPESFFSDVFEVPSPLEALRQVRLGTVDAAFAWTPLGRETEGGHSGGTLADSPLAGEGGMAGLAVLWNSLPITHGPFALLTNVPDADKAKIEDYLLALDHARPAAYDMLDPLYGGGYGTVDPRDYEGLKLLASTDIDTVRLEAVSLDEGSGEDAEDNSAAQAETSATPLR
jgi:phosphonate transport system substrate-binding protein